MSMARDHIFLDYDQTIQDSALSPVCSSLQGPGCAHIRYAVLHPTSASADAVGQTIDELAGDSPFTSHFLDSYVHRHPNNIMFSDEYNAQQRKCISPVNTKSTTFSSSACSDELASGWTSVFSLTPTGSTSFNTWQLGALPRQPLSSSFPFSSFSRQALEGVSAQMAIPKSSFVATHRQHIDNTYEPRAVFLEDSVGDMSASESMSLAVRDSFEQFFKRIDLDAVVWDLADYQAADGIEDSDSRGGMGGEVQTDASFRDAVGGVMTKEHNGWTGVSSLISFYSSSPDAVRFPWMFSDHSVGLPSDLSASWSGLWHRCSWPSRGRVGRLDEPIEGGYHPTKIFLDLQLFTPRVSPVSRLIHYTPYFGDTTAAVSAAHDNSSMPLPLYSTDQHYTYPTAMHRRLPVAYPPTPSRRSRDAAVRLTTGQLSAMAAPHLSSGPTGPAPLSSGSFVRLVKEPPRGLLGLSVALLSAEGRVSLSRAVVVGGVYISLIAWGEGSPTWTAEKLQSLVLLVQGVSDRETLWTAQVPIGKLVDPSYSAGGVDVVGASSYMNAMDFATPTPHVRVNTVRMEYALTGATSGSYEGLGSNEQVEQMPVRAAVGGLMVHTAEKTFAYRMTQDRTATDDIEVVDVDEDGTEIPTTTTEDKKEVLPPSRVGVVIRLEADVEEQLVDDQDDSAFAATDVLEAHERERWNLKRGKNKRKFMKKIDALSDAVDMRLPAGKVAVYLQDIPIEAPVVTLNEAIEQRLVFSRKITAATDARKHNLINRGKPKASKATGMESEMLGMLQNMVKQLFAGGEAGRTFEVVEVLTEEGKRLGKKTRIFTVEPSSGGEGDEKDEDKETHQSSTLLSERISRMGQQLQDRIKKFVGGGEGTERQRVESTVKEVIDQGGDTVVTIEMEGGEGGDNAQVTISLSSSDVENNAGGDDTDSGSSMSSEDISRLVNRIRQMDVDNLAAVDTGKNNAVDGKLDEKEDDNKKETRKKKKDEDSATKRKLQGGDTPKERQPEFSDLASTISRVMENVDVAEIADNGSQHGGVGEGRDATSGGEFMESDVDIDVVSADEDVVHNKPEIVDKTQEEKARRFHARAVKAAEALSASQHRRAHQEALKQHHQARSTDERRQQPEKKSKVFSNEHMKQHFENLLRDVVRDGGGGEGLNSRLADLAKHFAQHAKESIDENEDRKKKKKRDGR
eukprot:GHVS01041997.1.p1 GENE.GHVS01041997.1~~GHVS01041997.1.p1  ORF type:complete len:1189 (+),score=259.55 GHVS01041997.1:153-3719(+)